MPHSPTLRLCGTVVYVMNNPQKIRLVAILHVLSLSESTPDTVIYSLKKDKIDSTINIKGQNQARKISREQLSILRCSGVHSCTCMRTFV